MQVRHIAAWQLMQCIALLSVYFISTYAWGTLILALMKP